MRKADDLNVAEVVGGKHQEPCGDDEGAGHGRNLPRPQHAGDGHHQDGGKDRARHDVPPQQGRGREEGRQGTTHEDAVIAVQPDVDVLFGRSQGVSGKRAHDRSDHRTDSHGDHVRGVGAPKDADQEKQPGQRIVLEHDLPRTTQADVNEVDDRILGRKRVPWVG